MEKCLESCNKKMHIKLKDKIYKTIVIVQAFCNLTSHKLQQKQFHLFQIPDSILYDIKKVLRK